MKRYLVCGPVESVAAVSTILQELGMAVIQDQGSSEETLLAFLTEPVPDHDSPFAACALHIQATGAKVMVTLSNRAEMRGEVLAVPGVPPCTVVDAWRPDLIWFLHEDPVLGRCQITETGHYLDAKRITVGPCWEAAVRNHVAAPGQVRVVSQ